MLLVLPPRTRKVLVPNAKALHTKPVIASLLSVHIVAGTSMHRTSVGPTQLPLDTRGQSGPRSSGLRLEGLLLHPLVLLLLTSWLCLHRLLLLHLHLHRQGASMQ